MKPEVYIPVHDLYSILNPLLSKLRKEDSEVIDAFYRAFINLLSDISFDLHQWVFSHYLTETNYLTIKKDFLVPYTDYIFTDSAITIDATNMTVNGTSITSESNIFFTGSIKIVANNDVPESSINNIIIKSGNIYVSTSSNSYTFSSLNFDLDPSWLETHKFTIYTLSPFPSSVIDIPFIYSFDGSFIAWHSEDNPQGDLVIYKDSSNEKTVSDLQDANSLVLFTIEDVNDGKVIHFDTSDMKALAAIRPALQAEVELTNNCLFERMAYFIGLDLSSYNERERLFIYQAIYAAIFLGPTIAALRAVINAMMGSEIVLEDDTIDKIEEDKIYATSGRVYNTQLKINTLTGEAYKAGDILKRGMPIDNFVVIADKKNKVLNRIALQSDLITALDNYTFYLVVTENKKVFTDKQTLIYEAIEMLKPIYTRVILLAYEVLQDTRSLTEQLHRYSHSLFLADMFGGESGFLAPVKMYNRLSAYYLDGSPSWGYGIRASDELKLFYTSSTSDSNTAYSGVTSIDIEYTVDREQFLKGLVVSLSVDYDSIDIWVDDSSNTCSFNDLKIYFPCWGQTQAHQVNFTGITYTGTNYTVTDFFDAYWAINTSCTLHATINFSSATDVTLHGHGYLYIRRT